MGKGTLELDGSTIGSGDLPQTVTKDELDNDKLKYDPPEDENGNDYTTFTFKVNDGEDDSANDYTMTIDVDSVPDVTQVQVTSTPKSGTTPKKYGAGEEIQVTVTFDEAVTVTDDPHVNVAVGANTRDADYARGSGSAALVFEYTVVTGDTDSDGIAVNADVELDTDSSSEDYIRDGDGNDADLTFTALAAQSAHQVDGSLTPPVDNTAPSVSSAATDGATLVITFNEDLAAAPNLANGAFTVGRRAHDDSVSSFDSVSLTGSPVIAGRTVTLTLANAPLPSDDVRVVYGKPITDNDNRLEDASDNEVAGFTQSVTNNTPVGLVFSGAPVTVDEEGTETYTVKLAARPRGTVSVAIASDDAPAATAAPTPLTFTTSTWDDAQTVTVTGVVDADENNESVTLTHSGTDVTTGEVAVTVHDNDGLPQLVFEDSADGTAVTALEAYEGRGRSTYAVRLNKRPSADVTVQIESGDTSAVTVVQPSPNTLDSTNWKNGLVVGVQAIEDLDKVSETVTITHSGAGVRTGTLSVKTLDDDADPPNPAANLRVTAWDPDDGPTIEWDLPAAQPSGVTVAKWILQVRQPSRSLNWLNYNPLAERRTAFSRHTTTVVGRAGDQRGWDVRVVLESGDGGQAASGVLSVDDVEVPTNLRIDGLAAATAIPLAWDLPSPQAGWLTVNALLVQRKDGGTWSTVATLAGDATSTMLTGLKANTAYTFRVALDTNLGTIAGDDPGADARAWVLEVGGRNYALGGSDAFFERTGKVGVAVSSHTYAWSSAPGWDSGDVGSKVTVSLRERREHSKPNSYVFGRASDAATDQLYRCSKYEDGKCTGNQSFELRLTEGQTGRYKLKLGRRPDKEVTVRLRPRDPDAIRVSPRLIAFTPANYNDGQVVTVEALQDNDGLDEYDAVIHEGGGGAAGNWFRVRIADDDEHSQGGHTLVYADRCHCLKVNQGATKTFTVKPRFQPDETMTMVWYVYDHPSPRIANQPYENTWVKTYGTNMDGTEWVKYRGIKLSPLRLTFDQDNWDTPQEYTVTVDADAEFGAVMGLRPWWWQGEYPYTRSPDFRIVVANTNQAERPGPPAVDAVPGDGEVRLGWTPPDDGDAITNWQFRYGEMNLNNAIVDWGRWTAVPGGEADARAHTVTGLANGTSYGFQVRGRVGRTAAGESVAAVAMPMAWAESHALKRPELDVVSGNALAELSWDDIAYSGTITGWRYRYGVLDGPTGAVDWGEWTAIAGAEGRGAGHAHGVVRHPQRPGALGGGRRSPGRAGRDARLRGDARPRGGAYGHGGLRHVRRDGDGGLGLHGDLGHAHLRRRRH